MSTLKAWDAWGHGFNMSHLYNGLGFIPNDPTITTNYLGALDDDTIAYEVSGSPDFGYFTVSGDVNLISGDVFVTSIYWLTSDFNFCITWDDANLLINAFDDFSAGTFASLLNLNDTIIGNSFNDLIKGSNGNDRLLGNGGNDKLYGERGDDRLLGGIGNDVLIGSSGKDVLTGGSGKDVFDYNSLGDSLITGRDTITDFLRGTDRIDLSGIDANFSKGGNQAFTKVFIGKSFNGLFDGSVAGAGKLFYATGADILYGNTDSDATPEFAISVILSGFTPLGVADFIL